MIRQPKPIEIVTIETDTPWSSRFWEVVKDAVTGIVIWLFCTVILGFSSYGVIGMLGMESPLIPILIASGIATAPFAAGLTLLAMWNRDRREYR